MSGRRRSGKTAPEQVLGECVRSREVIVCCGAGGVGKTTSAAAIALRASEEGRRTIVLTIDPARRLAQSLGLAGIDDTARPVPGTRCRRSGGRTGELHAMMLDMKRTFDEVIRANADSPARASRILSNPFYQSLSSTLAGTQEYMAMEKLHELHAAARWDLIVVDTPPTRSALDFLDAPRRLTDFLEGRLLKTLLLPAQLAGKTYARVFSLGANAFLRAAGRMTGSELISDVAEFFQAFEGMYDGFKRRAREVYELLQAPTTAFVVVSSPEEAAMHEAEYFARRLAEERMPLEAVVVNRVHRVPAMELPDRASLSALRASAEGRLLAELLANHEDWSRVARREEKVIGEALATLAGTGILCVPHLPGDVHDLGGLRLVNQFLFG
ncbi:MAG: ArsA family ATPase [Actinomycetota bacterium]